MLDIDTFLITLYTTIDDFCRQHLLPESACAKPGRIASLSRSETMTLALFGQLARFTSCQIHQLPDSPVARFTSERDFWRFATRRLTHLFPCLPERTQFNRLEREHQETILAFFQHLVGGDCLDAQNCAFEIVDRVGVATRWCNRRGVGWMPEDTDKGKCSRLGFFHGFHLLTVVNPNGIITGFGVAAASTTDQPLADAVFTARHTRDRRCPGAGLPCRSGDYIGDRGFIGQEWHDRLRNVMGIDLINPPRKTDAAAKFWPKVLAQSFVSLAGGSTADGGNGA